MSQELERVGAGEVLTRKNLAEQLMEVVRANPTAGADNLRAMLDAAERMTKWQSERDFIEAFNRMKFPPIHKGAKNHNGKYAAYDEIQAIVDPILAEHGFTLGFPSIEVIGPRQMRIHHVLSHVGGCSKPGFIDLPIDSTKAMNDLQQGGSTISYGKRYATAAALGLRFVGEDNDGAGATIDRGRVELLDRAIAEADAKLSAILDMYGVKALSDLPRINYPGLVQVLTVKLRAKFAKEAMDEADINFNLRRIFGE